MKDRKLISIQHFCSLYDTPKSFFDDLYEYEIINFKIIDNAKHIEQQDIKMIEKLIRLHFDLNINMEGLDAIIHLTKQINELQEQINELKNRLHFYE